MAKWIKNKIELPEEFTASQRREFGDEIVSYIRNRTADGQGKDNKRFPGYSKAYIQSLDFRNAGKSSGKVNLKLSGDMMAALDIISHRKGQLLYGFKNGTSENDRAEGNVLGSYGGDPDVKKARDFMGVTKKEVDTIVDLVRGGNFGKLRRGISEGFNLAAIPERILQFLVTKAIIEKLASGREEEDAQ